jgi:hypothetical protein
MQFTMMEAADRNCELVADLAAKRTRLRETKVVWLCRRAAADDAGLPRDELAMILVTQANRLRGDPWSTDFAQNSV